MNSNTQGVLLDSYQYAPVYFIQDPNSIQAAGSYIIRTKNGPSNLPSNNNLKSFYENSNNIECEVLNSADATTTPAFLSQRDVPPVGNKLKLASFLLPNSENAKVQFMNNVITPNTTASNQSINNVVNPLPKLDIERKLVKIKDVPNMRRQYNKRTEKLQPKIKPKLKESSPTQSRYTSVQLIKLGETYHSLNKLSEDQIKMVNKALKMFKDPNKSAPEPTYDPVTNTRYIYKVVSPKDLAVVGKKKIVSKENKKCFTKPKKVEEKQVAPSEEEEEPETPPAQAKVTRSGRRVKLPKQIVPENSTHRTKKKSDTIVTCCQCSSDFGSLYRLQKHYEQYPTHMPMRIHSNLFHCLRAIVRGAGGGGNMLVQQLEQLLHKLRSLLPCLLTTRGTHPQPCTISDDLGRLFGMTPGKYHIDVEALDCVKEKDGSCVHNPRPATEVSAQPPAELPAETDCARISSVAKWPTVSKRNWKLKHRSRPAEAKRMRLPVDESDKPDACEPQDDQLAATAPSEEPAPPPMAATCDAGTARIKRDHIQFHSAHFDIRSSPIKSSSTIFRKFQIDPSKLGTFEARALSLAATGDASPTQPSPEACDMLGLRHSPSNVEVAEEESTDIDPEIKEWIIAAADKPREGLADGAGEGESVLTFLDALGAELAAPATVDFQLDLFT